jgi:hypothetical protein
MLLLGCDNMTMEEKKEEKTETKTPESKKHIIRINPWKILTIVFGILLIASILTRGFRTTSLSTGVTGFAVANVLTPEEAANKAIDWIKSYFKAAGQDINVRLVNTSEENGLYLFTVEFSSSQGNTTFTYYVTKDGELFIPQVIPTAQTIQAQQGTQEKATCETLPKSDTPKLEAFVVSYCPYGLQMQRVLAEIIKNIPNLANYIKVRYIGEITNGKITSMHGDREAQENLKQICIREEQSEKYWNYISCFIKKGESENCSTLANIDTAKLSACMNDSNKGLKYAQEDFTLQNNYQVSGSPTLILNGQRVSEYDFGGRSAEAVKELLCCGFNTTPNICSQNLTTTQAATSFSEVYSSSSSSSGGQC